MKIYIAGPMTGFKDFNFPAFFEAEERLQTVGHECFNPARHDVEKFGWNLFKGNGEIDKISAQGFSLRETLATDLAWIALHADAIALLPNGENSRGVKVEKALGEALGIQIAPVEEFLAVKA